MAEQEDIRTLLQLLDALNTYDLSRHPEILTAAKKGGSILTIPQLLDILRDAEDQGQKDGAQAISTISSLVNDGSPIKTVGKAKFPSLIKVGLKILGLGEIEARRFLRRLCWFISMSLIFFSLAMLLGILIGAQDPLEISMPLNAFSPFLLPFHG